MDLIDTFKKEYNNNAAQLGVRGTELASQRKNFEVTENDEKRKTSNDYLKDGVTLTQINTLAKNKRLSNNKIKSEIRKLLKNPEELYDFLNSFKKGDTKKEESTEATGSGGSGSYVGPLFSGEEPDIKKVETKEATGSASSGSYESPSFLAKSMSKKNWRGKSKTQIPGGKFVQVKKKCKKFPYCNQGDINALKIFENESLNEIIQKVGQQYNLHEDHIKDIILHELRKTTK